MKASYKREWLTGEKQQLYETLYQDKVFSRLIRKCESGSADHVTLACLVSYCYQVGYEVGHRDGVSAGIRRACEEITAEMDRRQAAKKDPG
jgi:hypothetical protein